MAGGISGPSPAPTPSQAHPSVGQQDSPTSSTKPGGSLSSAASCTHRHPNLHPPRTRSLVSPHGERRLVGDSSRDTGRASSRWHQCSSAMPTGMPRQDANLVPVPQHDADHVAQPRQDANPAVPSGSNANHAGVAGSSARGAGPGVPVGSEQRCPPKQTWGTISASFTNSPQPQNGEEKGKKKSHLGPFALYSDLNTVAEHGKAITCSNYLLGDEGGNVTLNFKQEPEWGG